MANTWQIDVEFFLRLHAEGVKVCDNHGNNMCNVTWLSKQVKDLDAVPLDLPNDETWFEPTYWSEGGYDAIMMSRETLTVSFYQLATAPQQPFHVEYFSECLEAFVASPAGLDVKHLKVFFVTEDSKLAVFRVHHITGQGFCEYLNGRKAKG